MPVFTALSLLGLLARGDDPWSTEAPAEPPPADAAPAVSPLWTPAPQPAWSPESPAWSPAPAPAWTPLVASPPPAPAAQPSPWDAPASPAPPSPWDAPPRPATLAPPSPWDAPPRPAGPVTLAPPPPAAPPCLSDLCARGDRLDLGALDFDGVSAYADLHLGVALTPGDGELGTSSLVPVAGVAATWTADALAMRLPLSALLLVAPVQAWRDHEGQVVRTHGGALGVNVGGLVSLGVGAGHHNQLPRVFTDLDADGRVDPGELDRAPGRWTGYGFLMFTPVTFVRQVAPQLRAGGG